MIPKIIKDNTAFLIHRRKKPTEICYCREISTNCDLNIKRSRSLHKINNDSSQFFYEDLNENSDYIKSINIQEKMQDPIINERVYYNTKESAKEELSAQIMNLSYRDYKESFYNQDKLAKASTFDIFQRIKDAYNACSCKVCECITTKSLFSNNETCNCKPCDCNECKATYFKLSNTRNKTNCVSVLDKAQFTRSANGCSAKEKKCFCKPCECLKCTDSFTRPCDCKACQCIECKSMDQFNRKPLVIVPALMSNQGNCDCEPICQCANCRESSNDGHEISIEINRHPNCHCEMCVNDSCEPDGTTSCRCVRQGKVMTKPVNKTNDEYDIRQATFSDYIFNPFYDPKIKFNNDIITMFANVSGGNNKPSMSSKLCDCVICECLVCKAKSQPAYDCSRFKRALPRVIDIPDLRSGFCKCAPCECKFCVNEKHDDNGKNCYCDKCDCLNCDHLPSTSTYNRHQEKTKTMNFLQNSCQCSPCECIQCENNSKKQNLTPGLDKGFSKNIKPIPTKIMENLSVKLAPSHKNLRLSNPFQNNFQNRSITTYKNFKDNFWLKPVTRVTADRESENHKIPIDVLSIDRAELSLNAYTQYNITEQSHVNSFISENVSSSLVKQYNNSYLLPLKSNFSFDSIINNSNLKIPSSPNLKESSLQDILLDPDDTKESCIKLKPVMWTCHNQISCNRKLRYNNDNLTKPIPAHPFSSEGVLASKKKNANATCDCRLCDCEECSFMKIVAHDCHCGNCQCCKNCGTDNNNLHFSKNAKEQTQTLTPLNKMESEQSLHKHIAGLLEEQTNKKYYYLSPIPKIESILNVNYKQSNDMLILEKPPTESNYNIQPFNNKDILATQSNMNNVTNRNSIQVAKEFSFTLLKLLDTYEKADREYKFSFHNISSVQQECACEDEVDNTLNKKAIIKDIQSLDVQPIPQSLIGNNFGGDELLDKDKKSLSIKLEKNSTLLLGMNKKKSKERTTNEISSDNKLVAELSTSEHPIQPSYTISSEIIVSKLEEQSHFEDIKESTEHNELNTVTTEMKNISIEKKNVEMINKHYRKYNKMIKLTSKHIKLKNNKKNSSVIVSSGNLKIDIDDIKEELTRDIEIETEDKSHVKIKNTETFMENVQNFANFKTFSVLNKTVSCEGEFSNYLEHSRPTVLKKNFCLSAKPTTTNKGCCVFPSFDSESNVAHRKVSQFTQYNKMIKKPYKNEALISLQNEVNELLKMPIFNKSGIITANTNPCIQTVQCLGKHPKLDSNMLIKESFNLPSMSSLTPTYAYGKGMNCDIGSHKMVQDEIQRQIRDLLNVFVLRPMLTTLASKLIEPPEELVWDQLLQKSSNQDKVSYENLKVSSIGVRKVSAHTVLVRWGKPKEMHQVRGYELLIDGRSVREIFSPTRYMAVVTCLPNSEKILVTVRTVTSCMSDGRRLPATTIVYYPRVK